MQTQALNRSDYEAGAARALVVLFGKGDAATGRADEAEAGAAAARAVLAAAGRVVGQARANGAARFHVEARCPSPADRG